MTKQNATQLHLGVESAYLFTRGYGIYGLIKLFRGIRFSCEMMWDETMKVNLIRDVPKVKIPVYFVTGKYDYTTHFTIAEEYMSKLDAPSKKLFWFEKSSHSPIFEEPDNFNRLMVEILTKTKTY